MGRTQELRELFQRRARERATDSALAAFLNLVNAAIEPKGAWLHAPNDWVRALFLRAPTSPDDHCAWIAEKTAGLFLSKGRPPAWPDAHGLDWCFHDGQPLTFIGRLPNPGETESLFVFEGVKATKESGGRRGFYKMKVIADNGSYETILSGVIDA